MKKLVKPMFLVLLTVLVTPAVAGSIQPVDLTCEYLTNPDVVDVELPRLSWINQATEPATGISQVAYEIEVAGSKEGLLAGRADYWKSARVKSRESTLIRYGGKKLQSRDECWWRVRVWDQQGKRSAWSEPARWHMGLLEASDWKARWIGAPWQGEAGFKPLSDALPPPAPLLRKQFTIGKKIESAYLYTSGLGYFEVYCNGGKVSDDVLVPNQTLWGKREGLKNYGIPVDDNFTEYRVMYMCYDLTGKLQQGENALGAMLGNGFYNSASKWVLSFGTPRFIGQLEIRYTDGTSEVVVSDTTWKVEKSAVVFDMLYDGEHYDARLEYPGWDTPEFDDSNWLTAVWRKAPEGKMKAQMSYADKVMEQLEPVAVDRLPNGNYRVDFGEEISGWVRLSGINGKAGHRIRIRYLSESPNGANSYTLNGKGNESYAARFTWFVFRTVEIEGWPGTLTADNLVAEAVYTAVGTVGEFNCSNSLFNTINKIWKRTQTDNMHGGIASDCPHRERNAYTGDGQVVMSTVTHHFDVAAFYKKWIEDIAGAQDKTTGYVPNGAPWQPGCGGGVAWGAAIAVMPWEFYQVYGDKDILASTYEGMKGYLKYMSQWVDSNGIMHQKAPDPEQPHEWMNLGEWCPPGKFPPTELVHTFYYWLCTYNTGLSAQVLGKQAEAKQLLAQASATRDAFVKHFYSSEAATFGKYGANIFALKMGLPDSIRQRVVSTVETDMKEAGGHLDTGIFGTRYLFETLAENGLNELAYNALNKTTFPGFGYWIQSGATTTWETWIGEYSHNHPMFGGGLVWLYQKLAGMSPLEAGYRTIQFKPQPAGELEFASYFKKTPYGKAGIYWKRNGEELQLQVTVPVGSKAVIYVPSAGNDIKEARRQERSHLRFLRWEEGYAVYEAESGSYRLSGKLSPKKQTFALIPYPAVVEPKEGFCDLSNGIVTGDNGMLAKQLYEMLRQEAGIVRDAKGVPVSFIQSGSIGNPEGYVLDIQANAITIRAETAAGHYYALQTLRQLLTGKSVPCVTIEDSPAFAWRAFMLDEARHFHGKETVKMLLDEMARLKMNTFHWHLTDDAGWRIEIPGYPLLTSVGSRRDSTQVEDPDLQVPGETGNPAYDEFLKRYQSNKFDSNPHSGYYTREDIVELVKYAAERHIRIVPEISMPGHASAAIAAYPWLGTTGETIPVPVRFGVMTQVYDPSSSKVMRFLKDVLAEVSRLFPGDYIHIGGDEVKFDAWQQSESVKKYMQENGLRNYRDVQVNFTNEICTYIEKVLGKKMMGWNEILGINAHNWGSSTPDATHRLSDKAVVHFWTGNMSILKYAIDNSYTVVNSYSDDTYLNYSYAQLPLKRSYAFNPVPDGYKKNQIYGIGCQLWTEWIRTRKDVEKQVFPRIAAYAETGWTEPSGKSYSRFLDALEVQKARWKQLGYDLPQEY